MGNRAIDVFAIIDLYLLIVQLIFFISYKIFTINAYVYILLYFLISLQSVQHYMDRTTRSRRGVQLIYELSYHELFFNAIPVNILTFLCFPGPLGTVF